MSPTTITTTDPDELASVVAGVREMLDGDLASDFSSFESFHEWVDATTHYDALDTGDIITVDLYRSVYDVLVAEEGLSTGKQQ